MSSEQRSEWLLLAVLAALLLTIWAQPAGSPLVEHDETRYAEIAREMLVSGDYAVPHLNGIVWYEKPPLLFWTGAASMRVFGISPWAARFPSRVAGLGTILLLYFFVRRATDRRGALVAAIIAAGTPLAWGIGFLNITDGLLTFFVTAAILAGYTSMQQSRRGPMAAFAVSAGLASGCAFFAKGLIGILFPAAILGIWAVITHQGRRFLKNGAIAFASAAVVVLPWMAFIWKRSPDYLTFFLIREHFQRYTSAIHDRQEPIFFAAMIFALALLPALGILAETILRRHVCFTEAEKLLVVWFSFVVLFFSFSKSQLPAYVAPAIPAAAAFIALRFQVVRTRWIAWTFQSLAMTTLVAAVFTSQRVNLILLDPQLRSASLLAAVALLGTSWLAVYIARKDQWTAIALTFAGCAIVYATLVGGWPKSAAAQDMAALREEIQRARTQEPVEIVSYRTFLKGLPWLMKTPAPVVDPGGELAYGTEALRAPNRGLVWPEIRFWAQWKEGKPLVALVREDEVAAFEQRAGSVPFIIGRARRHLLVSNFAPSALPTRDPRTSTALYSQELDADSIAVPIASVPPGVMASARKHLRDQTIVRSVLERTGQGDVYELVGGGPRPRLVEIDLKGNLVYTEEIVDEREVPKGVMSELRHAFPGKSVVFVKRERREGPASDRFHILLSDHNGSRLVEIDAVGLHAG